MINSTYVGISAQLALQRRLDTIAGNVAHSSTAGFRAEQIRFTTVVSDATAPSSSYASIGRSYISRAAGEFVRTDNPLDVAVDGDGWLAVETAAGQAYTRDGRMQMTETGELTTVTGHAVLDAAGSSIRLDRPRLRAMGRSHRPVGA